MNACCRQIFFKTCLKATRDRLAMCIYIISKIWVCIKTCYFYVYTLDCNVSSIYKHKDWQVNISYSPSVTFICLLYYQPLPFLERCALPHFLKNKQNTNSHPFCKVVDIQLWLIKTTCFTYLLLKNRFSNDKNIEPEIWKCFIY